MTNSGARIEKEILRIYRQAERDLKRKWRTFLEKNGEGIEALYDDYARALNTHDAALIAQKKQAYRAGLKKYTTKNKQYSDMIASVTKDVTSANQQALAFVNSQLSDIYINNFEEVRNIINESNIAFNLSDRNTVKRMIKDGDIKLPKKKINIPRDIAWNTRKINNAVLQGILQGEPIDKIANRLSRVTNANRSAAIRNARTLITGAENRGRLDSYRELQEQGAVLKKVWIATDGDRTREWHAVMDGQEVDIDEPFIDGNGNELMYPADPDAEPETVYNCRCSMKLRIVNAEEEEIEEVEEEVTEAEEEVTEFDADAYSQERKDDALWAQNSREADEALRPSAEKAWSQATEEEKEAIYDYTAGSNEQNMPLRGYEGSWSNYVGTENISISQRKIDKIDATTRYIDRSPLEQDTWLQRGVDERGAAAFFGIDEDMFYGSEEDMQKVLLGKEVRDDAFCSHGSSKGSGFNGVIINTYCPKGTKAAYCEPFSEFGDGAQSPDWDGVSKQSGFGSELETLLQRGTSFNVTKVKKSFGNWYIDVEVVGQEARPLEEMFKEIF